MTQDEYDKAAVSVLNHYAIPAPLHDIFLAIYEEWEENGQRLGGERYWEIRGGSNYTTAKGAYLFRPFISVTKATDQCKLTRKGQNLFADLERINK